MEGTFFSTGQFKRSSCIAFSELCPEQVRVSYPAKFRLSLLVISPSSQPPPSDSSQERDAVTVSPDMGKKFVEIICVTRGYIERELTTCTHVFFDFKICKGRFSKFKELNKSRRGQLTNKRSNEAKE